MRLRDGVAVSRIGVGGDHTVFLRGSALFSVGLNDKGQCGIGSVVSPVMVPTAVLGLSGINIVSVAAGSSFTIALDDTGKVYGFGANNKGQVKPVAGGMQTAPVLIAGLPTIVQIDAGDDWWAALDEAGTVWVKGGNVAGQRGQGTSDTGAHPLPVQVMGIGGVGILSNVIEIACGARNLYALTDQGTVAVTGQDLHAETGQGAKGSNALYPVIVKNELGTGPLVGVVRIFGSNLGNFAGALMVDGRFLMWGANKHAQLGQHEPLPIDPHPLPVPVLDESGLAGHYLLGVVDAALGGYHAIFRMPTRVLAQGQNLHGELGINSNHIHGWPIEMIGTGMQVVTAISAGPWRSYVAYDDDVAGDTIEAAGLNDQFQLGLGDQIDRWVLTNVTLP